MPTYKTILPTSPTFQKRLTIAKAAGVQIRLLHQARQFGAFKGSLPRIYKVLFNPITIRTILPFARNPMLWSLGASALPRLIASGLSGLPAVSRPAMLRAHKEAG